MAGEVGGRVCSLDFRPIRFFGCRVEKVLAEFFSCDDPALAKMPEAIWDLTQGAVRPGLDDRVLVEAAFSPQRGHGQASVTLFYRIPSVDLPTTDKVLGLLDRRSTKSGYHRFGSGAALSLRGSTRVRTSIVGRDAGESLLVTTMILTLSTVTKVATLEAVASDPLPASLGAAGEAPMLGAEGAFPAETPPLSNPA